MSNIFLFQPRAELDAAGNLTGFVKSCREELTIFGANLPFDENVWDVSSTIRLKGHGKNRVRMVFNTFYGDKSFNPRTMAEPFLGFSKAYMRYMHGLRPVVGFSTRLTALRSLEAALSEQENPPNPIRLDSHIFNRAGQLVGDHFSDSAAYRIGGQLEMIATFLSDNKLTIAPIRWRNFLKRPFDSVRVGKKFDERRQSKMPSESVLNVLPKVFRLATNPADVIVSSVAAILCSAPDRINEVLLLPVNCEVHEKYGSEKKEAYGLRWWPAKGADPMVKWIIPAMSGVVQEAINKIRGVTEPARRIARWYEDHPSQIFLDKEFEHLRDKEWLSMKEVGQILGFEKRTVPGIWCKSNNVKKVVRGGVSLVRFKDLEKAVLRMLPRGYPFLNQKRGLKYGEALLVVRTNELTYHRATYRCMIEPITVNKINAGLGSKMQHGSSSIFSRLGFIDDGGNPIKITTHQFRHYLNTLAQVGGMSQLDIAKWSGRKDIRQNAAYDHVTPDQMLQKIRGAVGDDSQMFGPLAELPKKVLISRDEFSRLKVPTAHTTDIGFCIHDYSMSPCQLHMDCINCGDLVCIKGDEVKMRRLRQQLEEALALQERAKQAVDAGYAGSDRWLVHHSATVERLGQLFEIMDDPNVPLGAVVQLSPPRLSTQVEIKTSRRITATAGKVDSAEKLADAQTSSGA